MMVDQIKHKIDTVFEEVVLIRRHLHMYPELSNKEEKTMAFISDYLTELGIPHETNVGGHGVVGIIGNPQAEFSIGIRADIDALPIQEMNDIPYASKVDGVMHACGHDIHTAVLMGTAKILKEMEGDLKGAVKLFFQPAEENGGGARQMIAAGCMQNPPVRRVLGFHVDPTYPTGHIVLFPHQMCACSTGLRILVEGTTCHGSRPDHGVDAIIASAHVLTALQTVASRVVSPLKPVVVTVGSIHGGTKGNIIAGEVDMRGTIRTLDLGTRDFVKEHVKATAEAAAASCGAKATVVMRDGYPPVICDRDTTMLLIKVVEEAVGSEGYTIRTEPGMGGEDFSYFADAVPSSYFRLGTVSADTGHAQSLHSEWLCPDEDCMKNGMLTEILGTLALLEEEYNNIKEKHYD